MTGVGVPPVMKTTEQTLAILKLHMVDKISVSDETGAAGSCRRRNTGKERKMRCLLCAVISLAWAAVAVADDSAKVTPGKPIAPAGVVHAEKTGEINLSPKVPALEYERRLVLQILRLVRPGQTDTRIAEAALQAAGKKVQPILQELKEHPEKLVSDEDLAVTKYLVAGGAEMTDRRAPAARANELRQQRLQVVETMLTVLTQGFTPRRAIETWAYPQGGAPEFMSETQPVKVPPLEKLFPGYSFYSVVFPQWPVTMIPPAPLKSANVFVIDQKGKVQGLTTKEELEVFFRKNLAAVNDKRAAEAAVRAWLALAQVLATDGWFKFAIPDESITVAKTAAGLKATGKATVSPDRGDRGEMTVALDFDDQGKLTAVQQRSNLKAGMRPICQSTKLLDPDPIVRKMAEQSLLIMGMDALPYLQEQRAKVSPELQQAIDRIWQRILDQEAM